MAFDHSERRCDALSAERFNRPDEDRKKRHRASKRLPSIAFCPQIRMLISEWRVDEQGVLTRTITGVEEITPSVDAQRSAARAGGLAAAARAARTAACGA
jgi:hypothetical protein